MDYDGDGHRDLISGSYDPGELYLFRGLGQGRFDRRETLVDKNGKSILSNPDQTESFESFGSWVAMVDWDDDGDLDIVLGTFGGRMLLRVNEGTRRAPAFAVDNIEIEAGGAPLRVPSSHATPVVADWDGDGAWDLLSGSASGAVYWYRNTGAAGAPVFAAAQQLVAAHDGSGYEKFVDAGDPAAPGIRSQIAVADYDLDGKLDLLLGDFCSTISPRPDLGDEERAALQEVRDARAALAEEIKPISATVDAGLTAFMEQFERAEIVTDAVQQKIRDERESLAESSGLEALYQRDRSLKAELNAFLAKPAVQQFGADDMATAHGWVWLFRRK